MFEPQQGEGGFIPRPPSSSRGCAGSATSTASSWSRTRCRRASGGPAGCSRWSTSTSSPTSCRREVDRRRSAALGRDRPGRDHGPPASGRDRRDLHREPCRPRGGAAPSSTSSPRSSSSRVPQLLGDALRARMLAWQARWGRIGDVRGLGAMLAIELVRDPATKDPAPELAEAVVDAALQRGLLLLKAGVNGNCIRVLCPLTTSDVRAGRRPPRLGRGARRGSRLARAAAAREDSPRARGRGAKARHGPLRRPRRLDRVRRRTRSRARARPARAFYEAMRRRSSVTGGTVEKFAGDAVMAVFGAPAALEDHAERALHTGLAMQRRMRRPLRRRARACASESTRAMSSSARPRREASFVTGDAVNVADRLQKAAEPGEVLAGERTAAAAAGAFEFGTARAVEREGQAGRRRRSARSCVRSEPCVRGEWRASRGCSSGGTASSSCCVPRTGARRRTSEPHLVTLVGEPGVGKSRLVRELWEALAGEEPAPTVRTGRCLAYGDGITYWPLGEIVREHLGASRGSVRRGPRTGLAGREFLGLALGLDVAPGPPPARRARAAARGRGRVRRGARAAVPDRAPRRGHPLGRARPARPPRAASSRTSARPLVVARDRAAGHPGRPPGVGRRQAELDRALARPASGGRRLAHARRDAVRRSAGARSAGSSSSGPTATRSSSRSSSASWSTAARSCESEGTWVLGEPEATSRCPTRCTQCSPRASTGFRPTEKAALQAGAVVGRVFSSAPVVHLLDGVEPDFELLEERDLVADAARARRARTESSRSSTRSRARSPTARSRRPGAAGCTPRSPSGSRRAPSARTSARRSSPTTTRRRRIRMDADLVWARRRRRARARARARGALAVGAPGASRAAPRDGGGGRAVHAGRRALRRRLRAGASLARDRRGAGAAVRR